jgi:hypothetical protein
MNVVLSPRKAVGNRVEKRDQLIHPALFIMFSCSMLGQTVCCLANFLGFSLIQNRQMSEYTRATLIKQEI